MEYRRGGCPASASLLADEWRQTARTPPGTPARGVVARPGGRVRVVQPGAWRSDDNTPHAIGPGSPPSQHPQKSPDLGHGGAALAVRVEAGGDVRIWVGTTSGHTPRPAGYDSATGSLQDGEVAAGGMHRLTWSSAGGLSAVQQSLTTHPTPADPRGAWGIAGMRIVGDLLPEASGPPLDELVVGTWSGDLFVYTILPNADLSLVWRTHVPGAVGVYNAIHAADLAGGAAGGDGRPELYVAGSLGLWRFTRPDEGTP